MIERELTMEMPHQDAMDIHPRGQADACSQVLNQHAFFAKIEAAGFKYEICGRCGTVRITELH